MNAVGGIAGLNGAWSQQTARGTIKASYNTGNVSAVKDGQVSSAGGIAGANGGLIIASYNAGIVSVSSKTSEGINVVSLGGIAGAVDWGDIIACYNTGAITATVGAVSADWHDYASVGGIAGHVRPASTGSSSIVASYSIGTVTGSTKNAALYDKYLYTGGIVGQAYENGVSVQGNFWLDTPAGRPTQGIAHFTVGMSGPAGVENGTDTNAAQFTAASWPATTASANWGTGDGSGSGKYWKSLGSYGSSYPKLYWEN
jgi:hypothetical protein